MNERLGVSPRLALARYLTDLACLAGSLALARWLRIALPLGKPLDAEGLALHAPMLLLALAVWSATLAALGSYDRRRMADPVDEFQAVAGGIVIAALMYAGLLYLSYRGLSRLMFLYFVALDLALSVGGRAAWRALARRRGLERRNALIVGSGETGRRVAHALEAERADSVALMGYLSEGEQAEPVPEAVERLPVLGGAGDAAALIRGLAIAEVILALEPEAQPRLARWIALLQELPVDIRVAPDYSQLVLSRAQGERLGDLVLISLNEPVISPLDRALKRAFDLALSLLGLILLSPLLALIALAIALDSRGPILYLSRRVGEGERPFWMFKFRTMIPGADRAQEALISQGEDGRLGFAKRPDDARITRAGRWLRRYSLDELPQLVNVLRGEMSLVGPRPELPDLAARYAPWQRRRFSVPQGITGWWQISGRSAKAKHLHVEDDLYYIRHYSLALDLWILWRTIGAVLRRQGAY
jgi:exopolysaccharide biosynthesis polyprenyl glycosylphosphotransferase